jgi:RHS repeat-associated protein
MNEDRSKTESCTRTKYTYDLLGRLTQAAETIGTTNYPVSYQYNEAGEITSLTYPSNRVVSRTYDAIGRLLSVANGSSNYVSNVAYNPDFLSTGYTFGNGVAATFGFSSDRLQLQSINYANSGTTLFGQTFTYGQTSSNNFELTSITDSVDTGRNMTYGYDSLGRLSTAQSQGSTNYAQWGLSWTYDRYGNRTAQTVTAGIAPSNSVTVSATTNQITTTGYSYDSNGNMTNDGSNTLTYDAENRAVSAADGSGTASYSYNGLGLRAEKTFGGTTTVYILDGNNVIAEYAGGTLTNEYVYAGNSLVAEYDSGTLIYHGHDRLSNRLNMNSSGTVVGQQGHYPFGEDWYMTGTTTNRHFTAYDRDTESGNDYAKSRYHVNRLGRFLTIDPVRPRSASPQVLNRYSYVASDPINGADPDGRLFGATCDPTFEEDCIPFPCGDGSNVICGGEGCDPVWGCSGPIDPGGGSCGGSMLFGDGANTCNPEPVEPPPPPSPTYVASCECTQVTGLIWGTGCTFHKCACEPSNENPAPITISCLHSRQSGWPCATVSWIAFTLFKSPLGVNTISVIHPPNFCPKGYPHLPTL